MYIDFEKHPSRLRGLPEIGITCTLARGHGIEKFKWLECTARVGRKPGESKGQKTTHLDKLVKASRYSLGKGNQ